MKTLLWLKKVLTHACVFYTVLVTSVYLLGMTMDSRFIPTPAMIAGLLVFSAVLAAANTYLFSDFLNLPLRLAVHFVLTLAAFYISFAVLGGYKENGGSVLVVLLIYIFAYALCAVIVGLYRWLTAELRTSRSDYQTVYPQKDSYDAQFGGKK